MENKDFAIGIDLGTTFCTIGAYIEGKGVEIIPNKLNETTIPSVVTFTEEGILVGDQTLNKLVKEYKNTVYGIKRIIGLNFNDDSVKKDISLWPFDVVKSDKNDSPMIRIKINDLSFFSIFIKETSKVPPPKSKTKIYFSFSSSSSVTA